MTYELRDCAGQSRLYRVNTPLSDTLSYLRMNPYTRIDDKGELVLDSNGEQWLWEVGAGLPTFWQHWKLAPVPLIPNMENVQ